MDSGKYALPTVNAANMPTTIIPIIAGMQIILIVYLDFTNKEIKYADIIHPARKDAIILALASLIDYFLLAVAVREAELNVAASRDVAW